MGERVIVGMSGGVDSSVAAYLLKEQGYDVVGVTALTWRDGAEGDARRAAEALGIPHYVLDFRDVFKEKVVDYFIREYAGGRTPNPCIACNRFVKWEALLKMARELGAGRVATGHYARIATHPETGRLAIKAAETAKDQSYALCRLTQEQLAHTLMPLGGLGKPEVRAAAAAIGLEAAAKPDSQEICFIPDDDYAAFIADYITPAEGDFIDEQGRAIGRHKGVPFYTVGQRKGLGAFGRPMFVKAIDPAANTVTLAGDAALFGPRLRAENVNFMAYTPVELAGGARADAKIRYNHKAAPCTARFENGALLIEFDEPQRAITPGQAAVVYRGGYVLCGGTIV